ncbi:hypothetical protein BGZ58_011063 [Dissophora ornata]|nr:hypothetical protein BGZ58_011063 [Dissophora ornata]
MPDAPAANGKERDSENDFASASEGEEYESMETSAPLVAPPAARKTSPPTSYHSDMSPTSVQLPIASIRSNEPTRGVAGEDIPPSSAACLPKTSCRVDSWTDDRPLLPSPSDPYREQHAEEARRSATPLKGFGQEGGMQSNDALSSNLKTKEPGSGWGSFSSWINTAVSTVNEVIENPNVVVSRAQTISQGIRNVATEQIDRVYESLDPEYEYERERQSKQQRQHLQPLAPSPDLLQQTARTTVPVNRLSGPMQPPVMGQPHLPLADWGSDNGDISGLPRSPHSQQEQIQRQQPVGKLQPSQVLSEMSPNLVSGNKLAYNEDVAGRKEDDWGDDAWGDDWDQQFSTDLAEPTRPQQPLSKQDRVSNTDRVLSKNGADLKPLLPQTGSDLSIVKIGQAADSDTRSVRDLFAKHQLQRNTLQVPEISSGSTTLTPRQEETPSDQPSERRPSTELRPAQALFSTLDFASNALGSAVLGVHRKVTQASQSNASKVASGSANYQSRPISPSPSHTQQYTSKDTPSAREIAGKVDRLALANPTLEAVGGNVVSTGLGALEILGKKAVDVISDVVPLNMNLATLFTESGGRIHIVSMRSIASLATSRVAALTSSKAHIREMEQLDDLERLLGLQSLDSAVGELFVDLLTGHKAFRSVLSQLEKMGVQGTSHLRQLRNCTKKLSSLVPDTVNAFEHEWHNHQSRASERDFFARAPIKKFFESRLLSVYFDGLRALSQFTERTCDQTLKLAENFSIRLAEKAGHTNHSTPAESDERERLPPLVLAPTLRQFLGSLIAEIKFIAKTYSLALDAVLQAAKGFTTPLDRLDWEDLSMGLEKIKGILINTETPESITLVHSGAACAVEVLKSELIVDAFHGRLIPKARAPRRKQEETISPSSNNTASTQHPTAIEIKNSPARCPPVDQNTGQTSALLKPRAPSPNLPRPPPSGPTRPSKTFVRPVTPLGSDSSTSATTLRSKDPAPQPAGSASRRPSSASSQGSTRSSRVPPQTRPKLKDEDFFSILNDT